MLASTVSLSSEYTSTSDAGLTGTTMSPPDSNSAMSVMLVPVELLKLYRVIATENCVRSHPEEGVGHFSRNWKLSPDRLMVGSLRVTHAGTVVDVDAAVVDVED